MADVFAMDCLQTSTVQTTRARNEVSFKKHSTFLKLKELFGCGLFGIFERKTLSTSERFRVTRMVTSILSRATENCQLKETRSCTTLDTPGTHLPTNTVDASWRSQTQSTQAPRTDADAECSERYRSGRFAADSTCVVGMRQAPRRNRRFLDTANRSVLCDDPSFA